MNVNERNEYKRRRWGEEHHEDVEKNMNKGGDEKECKRMCVDGKDEHG